MTVAAFPGNVLKVAISILDTFHSGHTWLHNIILLKQLDYELEISIAT